MMYFHNISFFKIGLRISLGLQPHEIPMAISPHELLRKYITSRCSYYNPINYCENTSQSSILAVHVICWLSLYIKIHLAVIYASRLLFYCPGGCRQSNFWLLHCPPLIIWYVELCLGAATETNLAPMCSRKLDNHIYLQFNTR